MKPTITIHHVKEPLDPAKINLYCGRGNAPAGMVNARMGNPFVMKDQSDAERDRVCDEYAVWIFGRKPDEYTDKVLHRIAEHVSNGRQVALYCYCAPKRCHCESIRDAALATAIHSKAV